jgi:hypothetical protein
VKDAPALEHRAPSGFLRNEWADVPLRRAAVWKAVFHNPLVRRLALRADDRAPGARIVYMLAASVATGVLVWGLLQAARGAAEWITGRAPDVPAYLAGHFW